jgi:hypothetical protein
MHTPLPVRLVCAAATMAAVLVPALASPARTIRVPRMLSVSATIDRTHGRVAMAEPVTHVAFSWTGGDGGRVRFRTISDDGVASRWREAPETHDLAAGDRHHSGVIAIYGTRKVEFRRVVPRGSWMGPVTIDLLDALGGPKRELTVPSVAHGLASEPRIITRAEWGADESLQDSSGGCARTFFPVQQLFVHHTAGANRDLHPRSTMRSILWFHTARRGWCDIGYNFVIGPNGEVFEGRRARDYLPWEAHDEEDPASAVVRGAHTGDYNPGAVGISLMGTFTSVRPKRAARRSLIRVLAWEADRHGLNPTGRRRYVNGETGARRRLDVISGHRDVSYTSCPGALLYRSLPRIRRAVAERIGAGKLDTALSLAGVPSSVTYGGQATVAATLTSGATALKGRIVRIYGQDQAGGAWQLLTEGPADASGRVALTLDPETTWLLAAAFDGGSRAWSAQSSVLRVPVRPVVTLQAIGGTTDPDGVVHFPSGTTGVALQGTVTPAHPGKTVRLTVERLDEFGAVTSSEEKTVPLTEDGSSYAYMLPIGAGDYRLRSTLPRHRDHARGRSTDVVLSIEGSPV